MRAGFSSRSAAIKIACETNANFTTTGKLLKWLKSDEIIKLSTNQAWPTPETHKLWIEFLENFIITEQKEWEKKSYFVSVLWDDRGSPARGTPLKIVPDGNAQAFVQTADGKYSGFLELPINANRKGLLLAQIMPYAEYIVMLTYIGPKDFSKIEKVAIG